MVGAGPSGWTVPAQIFTGAGWRTGHLTVCQRRDCTERGGLFRSRPGGRDRMREYARRPRVEATFAESKGRGWGLEQARWWRHALGRTVSKTGRRVHFDRTERRDRSVIRLGGLWLHDDLRHDRGPPRLFHQTSAGWQVRGLP